MVKKLKQIISENSTPEEKKFTSLVRAGLYDAKKLPLLKRALGKDATKTTPVERQALMDLLDRLMNQVLNHTQVYQKVRTNVVMGESSDDDLEAKIQRHKDHMKISSMSDDRYHTNGSYKRDSDALHALEKQRDSKKVNEERLDELKRSTYHSYVGKVDSLERKTKYSKDPKVKARLKKHDKGRTYALDQYWKKTQPMWEKGVRVESFHINEDHKKIAKKILPSGHKYNEYPSNEHTSSWEKRGGHAGGNSLGKTVKKAEKHGFKHVDHKSNNNADGSRMGHGSVYKHPDGHELHVRQSYGSIARDNYFHAKLISPKKNIKEAVESGADVPVVLILKRKALRMYPDGQLVALYYSDKLDKYVTIPFTTIGVSEETDQLKKIEKAKNEAERNREKQEYEVKRAKKQHSKSNDKNSWSPKNNDGDGMTY